MRGSALVFGFVVVAALSQPGHAGKEFDKLVKVTASASKIDADGKQKVAFVFAIEKGWYIYANPVGDKDYEDNHTTIEFSGSNNSGLTKWCRIQITGWDLHSNACKRWASKRISLKHDLDCGSDEPFITIFSLGSAGPLECKSDSCQRSMKTSDTDLMPMLLTK